MQEFLLLMHNDYDSHGAVENWQPYLDKLSSVGALRGGSAIGAGVTICKAGHARAITGHLTGYLKILARNIDDARELVQGNPVYEAGGAVEIRELPVTG
ncbi:MAG: hypothetical protein AB7O43_05325 [Hyphomicrobiaceae bacterium]